MTDAHQFVAFGAVAVAALLLAGSAWSLLAGRRSGGATDHRFAVDRLILAASGTIAANGLIGLGLIAAGSRPADPLHLLYGPVALATPIVGWWLGGRSRASAAGPDRRGRRDAWLVVASIVLLGILLRLFATG